MKRRLAKRFQPLAVPLKITVLVLVFARFHATWIGLTVTLASAFLLFGVDRAIGRWARRAFAGER